MSHLHQTFDPNGPAEKGKIFGLPYSVEEAKLVLLPVPWEVTVSYSSGTAEGPNAIMEASAQVDLYQDDIQDAWRLPVAMAEQNQELKEKGAQLRELAEAYIDWLERGEPIEEQAAHENTTQIIDAGCKEMIGEVYAQSSQLLSQGKVVGLVGGDHSTPLGLIKALADMHASFGVLQIDAHADLRNAYEGFEYSHASISYNFMKLPQVTKLVQVGIRDYCQEEADFMKENADRVNVFFDKDLKRAAFRGQTWAESCDKIVSQLPNKVYISFDIDGLDPKLCPDTGTPVPGGFELEEILYLFETVVRSGRSIIGFDLNEVSPGAGNEWNGNVGARALFRMCLLTGVSQGHISLK